MTPVYISLLFLIWLSFYVLKYKIFLTHVYTYLTYFLYYLMFLLCSINFLPSLISSKTAIVLLFSRITCFAFFHWNPGATWISSFVFSLCANLHWMKRERLSDDLCACMRACACIFDECVGVHGKGGSILQKKKRVKLQSIKKPVHLMILKGVAPVTEIVPYPWDETHLILFKKKNCRKAE